MKGRDGIEVDASATIVWTIRNGAIERVTMYQERQDALEDLGLSESKMLTPTPEAIRAPARFWCPDAPENDPYPTPSGGVS